MFVQTTPAEFALYDVRTAIKHAKYVLKGAEAELAYTVKSEPVLVARNLVSQAHADAAVLNAERVVAENTMKLHDLVARETVLKAVVKSEKQGR